jgi:hypothetical protein
MPPPKKDAEPEEKDVGEGTLNEFDHARHVKLLNTHMKKLGYENIGAGTDAQVFAKETGPVKKILMPKSGDISTAENSFLAFYNYCQANARNPHLPKFHQIQDNIELDGERFRQITMERLEEVDPEYEDMLVSMTDGIEDGTPLDPQYQPYIKFYQTLKSVMLTGRKLGFENDIITFQSVNIMQRGNTLVIIDPWTGGGGLEEGWFKNAVAGAALAGAALTGAGNAQAADLSHYNTEYLQKAADENRFGRYMVSIDDAKAELQARANGKQQATTPEPSNSNVKSGYSKEYLQKAADPNRFGRYLISVERAQELLNKMNAVDEASKSKDKYVPVSESVENIMAALIDRIIVKEAGK